MAAKGFFALVDDTLSEAYHYIAPDKTRHRKSFLAGLDKALANFNNGKQRGGASSMWSANNNVVHFTPKLGSKPVALDEGKHDYFIPAERFPNALAELRKETEAGLYDDALHAASGTNDPLAGGVKLSSPQQAKDKPPRAGWSPERRKKMEDAAAARRAAKAK